MKMSLFFKILLAFWLTQLVMALGFLLISAAYRGDAVRAPSPSQTVTAVADLLSERLRDEGPAAATAARDRLSPDLRAAFEIARTPGAPSGYKVVTVPLPETSRAFPGGLTIALVVALAGLLFSVAVARSITRPITALGTGFGRLAAGDLRVRVGGAVGERNDELGVLARDFDAMVERLAQLVAARDRLLNDVSHELRSPLTRLQLAIALARQDPARMEASMERISREAARLESMVQELLALARAEGGSTDEDYFDPVAIALEVTDDCRFEAEARGVSITLSGPATPDENPPVVQGAAELFRRAIENVLRNAIRFSPAASTVRIDFTITSSSYRFVIADEGPGAGTLGVEAMFEAFSRTGTEGTGLGLAIARRAVAALGGRIDAINREEGGLQVEIVLPAYVGALE
jgi:two-component system OmpR family sensor kinase